MDDNNIYKPTITVKISDVKVKIIRIGPSAAMALWRDDNHSNLLSNIHSHIAYEVIFVTKGSLEVRTQSENTVYERRIVVIPPSISHYTVPSQEGCYCLLFSIEKAKDNDSQAKYLNEYLQKGISDFELSDDVVYYIDAFSRKSMENTHSAEKSAALLAELIFREIISFVTPSASIDTKKSEAWYVGAIETYINVHIRDKITLSDIAKHVYLSNKQVSRIIKRVYGVTLSEIIARKKLEIAQMYLKNSDMKIKDIASKVNIGTENYFYTLFKKYNGISPLEYRNMHRDVLITDD